MAFPSDDDGVSVTTINEVAQAAGVSISTVSYALSGKRPVSENTRLRITAAVRDLGYEPNAGARMLAGRRTHIFALTEPLRPDTHAPTHMAFVLATAVAARRHGYDILLLTDEQASAGMNRVAASDLADAILVLDVGPQDERVAIARSIDIPTVFVGVPDDSEGLECVDLDFDAAGRLAVDRLTGLGHIRIGFIGQTDRAYEMSNFPRRVRSSIAEQCALRGAQLIEGSSGSDRPSAAKTRRAVARALDAGATALVLHCTEDAYGAVIAEIDERDLRVPDDVSLLSVGASFDTGLLPTPMNSIPLIPEASCDLAVALAVAAVEDPVSARSEPRTRLIPPTYVDRASVGPPGGNVRFRE